MCNLCSITTNQEAISRLFRKVNRYSPERRIAVRGKRLLKMEPLRGGVSLCEPSSLDRTVGSARRSNLKLWRHCQRPQEPLY
jgi:hypothetical protein